MNEKRGLANKAGAETAGFLFLALTVFSVGSILHLRWAQSNHGGSLTHRLRIVLSVRCQRLGVKFISYSYLNVTGIVAVTSILSLFIWAPKFSIKPSCLSVQSFPFKILTSTSYYLFTESSNCMGSEYPCDASAKVEKKRYEAYLDQIGKEEE